MAVAAEGIADPGESLSSWTQYPAHQPNQPGQQYPKQYPTDGPDQGKRTNGYAIASLIFGILASIPLGLIFGIIGLVKSKTYGSGKVMSWIGIALSIVWVIPAVAVLVTLGPRNAKANDPGCVAVESSRRPLYRKMIADAGDDEAFKADLQTMIADLHDGAGKTHSDSARAAMNAMASDYQQVLNALNGNGTGTDALARFDSDANAVDVACSHS